MSTIPELGSLLQDYLKLKACLNYKTNKKPEMKVVGTSDVHKDSRLHKAFWTRKNDNVPYCLQMW